MRFSAAALAMIGAGLSTVVGDPMAQATLSFEGTQPITGSIDLNLRIENLHTSEALYILKSHLPSPTPPGEDLFYVATTAGLDVTFQGISVKRLAPVFPDDFVMISPSSFVDYPFNLRPDYDFSSSDSYEVTYDAFSPQLACDPTFTTCLSQIPSNTLALEVVGMRRNRQLLERRLADTFENCDATQKATLMQAKKDALKCACDSLDCITPLKPGGDDNDYFLMFFGDDEDQAYIDEVKGKFQEIKKDLEGDLKFVCDGPECKPGWFAYVFPDKSTTVYLCQKFWDADPKGKDSKMGVLVHEVSHYDDGADTHPPHWAVGLKQVKELATNDPEKARDNADTYEYFCECLPRDGWIRGEPHIKKWGGGSYDYQGQCDLVMIQNSKFSNGTGLDVHIRTEIVDYWSYIKSAAVRIGGDILEVAAKGSHYINGIRGAEMPNNLSGYGITYTKPDLTTKHAKWHVFEVDLGGGQRISIKSFGANKMLSVSVTGAMDTGFAGSVGLMGTYESGALLARDGVTVHEDLNAFGQEWQVNDSDPKMFQSKHFPQFPEKCMLPTPATESLRGRRLEGGISQQEAELACADWGEAKDDCVFDVIATGDLTLAEAGGY